MHLHSSQRLSDLKNSLLELDGYDAATTDPASVPLFSVGCTALEERVREFGTPQRAFGDGNSDGPPTGHEALRQLLGAHADYDGEASTVVPMDISLLAVPTAPGHAQDVLSASEGSYSVQGFCEQYLFPNAEAARAREASNL